MGGDASDAWSIQVACGASHTLFLFSGWDAGLERSVMFACGLGEDGQLGLGDADEKTVPEAVVFKYDDQGTVITSIACGAEHSIACSAPHKRVYSWGEGDFGRLGTGANVDLYLPNSIPALIRVPVKKVFCGDNHTLAALPGCGLLGWGRNQFGQLGLGHTEDVFQPVAISTFTELEVVDIACGAEHSVAVDSKGSVYSWGWGCYGNLGLGDRNNRHTCEKLQQTVAENDGKVVGVACGWRHTALVTDAGALYTFGWSKYGQLGHQDNEDHLVSKKVDFLQDRKIVKCVGGWRHTAALTDEGRLYTWGWNKFGQCGIQHTNDVNTPTHVMALEDKKVLSVACGWRHTVAVVEGPQVFTWGRGASGQLGHGDNECIPTPKQVAAVDDILRDGPVACAAKKKLAACIVSNALDRYSSVPQLDVHPEDEREAKMRRISVESVVPGSF